MPSTDNNSPNAASPKGFFAWGPDDLKRLRRMEESIRRLFEASGYAEIRTPVVEFASTIEAGLGPNQSNSVFRLTDRRGDHLALRFDMTAPAARFFASSLSAGPLPVKLSYIGAVYRQSGLHEGRPRELIQAGCECFGGVRPDSSAEIIDLAIKTLKELGLKEFKLDIGHTGLFQGLLGSAELPSNQREAVREAIHRKDIPDLTAALNTTSLDKKTKEALIKLPQLYGQEEIFLQAATISDSADYRAALEELHAVYGQLMAKNHAQDISVDLGVVRDMDYYTGIVFEGLVAGCGAPICAGGEYDRLTAQFGVPAAAVGFMLELDEIFHLAG